MNGNGALKAKPTTATPQKKSGLYVPRQYAAPAPAPAAGERSLQVNIDSADDAKSVIQNLRQIKAAYEASNCDSVEFCIAEPVVAETENTLRGAINWCKTYVKHMVPQPGNVFFHLPAFKDFSVPPYVSAKASPILPESTTPANPAPTAPVKPQRPVRAESAKA